MTSCRLDYIPRPPSAHHSELPVGFIIIDTYVLLHSICLSGPVHVLRLLVPSSPLRLSFGLQITVINSHRIASIRRLLPDPLNKVYPVPHHERLY